MKGPRKGKGKVRMLQVGRFDTTKAMASAVENEVAEKMKAVEQKKTNGGDETEGYIMTIFQKFAA